MNKQRKTSHILNVFQYDADGHVVLPASLTLGIAPTGEDNSGKVPTTAWVRSIVGGAVTAYAPASRTITINGTSYDLSSNRSWSIDTGVLTASAGSGISVSVVSQNLNIVNTGLLTATSGSGISVSTVSQNLNIVNTGLLSATAGAGISVSTVSQNLNIVNTGLLTATAGSGITVSVVNQNLNVVNTGILTASAGSGISLTVVGQNLNVVNTGVLTATAGAGISLSIVGGNLNVVNTITNNNQLTNGAGYITSSALTGYATETYVGTAISNLVDAAPGTLDTLNELAAALGDDPNFATTVSTSIGTKVPQTRTLTINGTSYDLTANRSWTINSMVYPSAGIALSTGTAWGTSITDNSANWNTAFGWGNHASAGYLASATAATTYVSLTGSYANPAWITSLGWSKITSTPTTISGYGITNAYTDAQIQNFFNGANAITGYNKSNWDTAYGWGNHAVAGYLTTASAASTYVPVSGYAFGTSFTLGTMYVGTGEQFTPTTLLGVYSNGYAYKFPVAGVQAWLGLGSMAYASTGSYLPLSGGNITGRVEFQYATDKYSQAWRNNTTGAYWWVTTESDKLGFHRNGDGDKFYFSNGGDFWSSTNGWLSTALAGKSNTGHNHDGVYMKTNRTLDTINTIDNGGDRYNPSVNNPTNEHYAVLTYGNGGNVTGQLATHFVSGQLYSRGYNSSWSSWSKYVIENGGSWGISVTGSAGSVAWTNVTSRPTALSQFTNDLGNYGGWITGYTETDTLASVTGRGATTSSPITINGGGSQPLTLTTASGSPWHLALVRNDLGLTSRVFAHNSPYNGWYFEHNISIAGNTNWHSGNLTNLNQLSNGPGYITSESDTLSSVISRGNTTGGNIITSANMYASIFYDYANNGYYGDFAGTSNMYRLQLGGGAGGTYAGLTVQAVTGNTGPIVAKSSSYATTWSILPWTAGTTYISTGTYYDNGTWIHASSDSTNALFKFSPSGTSWYSSDNSTTNWNVASDSPLWNSVARWVNNVTAPNDVRAPIFYDSNDTTYYLDPNSSTALFSDGVVVAGNQGFQSRFYANGRNRIWSFYNSDNYGISYFQGGPDYIGLHFGNPTQAASQFWVSDSGIAQASGSMRAPIFYDSNDTAYYLNPAGGSRLRNLYVGDSGDDWSDPGGWGTQVRFSNGPHVRFVLHARSPGIEAGMYVHTPGSVYIGSYTSHDVSMMYAGNRKMQITNSYIYTDVYLEAAGSLRAPIFYDSANTAYYGDFASTSRMNNLILGTSYPPSYEGQLVLGHTSYNFNFLNGSWAGSITAGILANCADEYEFAIHDSGNSVESLFIYQSSTGRILMGRDIGWGTTPIQAAADFRAPQFRFTNSGNSAYFTGDTGWGARIYTDSGYIWFGPANSSYAHIYTDRGQFYFNADILINGTSLVKNDGGSYGISISGNAGSVGGYSVSSLLKLNEWNGNVYLHTDGRIYGTIFYDANNDGYYLNPNGTSSIVNLHIQGGGFASNAWSSSSGNEAVRVYAPGGASASWDGGITGAFRIKLPQRANNTMWTMTVRIYNYSTNHTAEYTMGNYSYDQGGYNASAHFIGAVNAPVCNVRFGNQDGVDCVWIGETSSGWSYPVVSVIDFQGGFRAGNATTWDDGWNITYVTSFGTVATTIYPNIKVGNLTADGSLYTTGNLYLGGQGSYYLYNSASGVRSNNNLLADGDIYLGTRGTWLSTYLNQNVRTDSSPSFAALTVSGTTTLNSQVTINRHIDANTGWGNASGNTIFVGWSGGKVVLGSNANGGHDYARDITVASVVSTNPFFCFQDITAFSDARVKDNVEVIDNAIQKVKAIRGVTYTRSDNVDKEKRHAGVIAQEVLKVLPEVVSGSEDSVYSVAYGNLNALLIEAIKEQQKQIEDLTNKIDLLTQNK